MADKFELNLMLEPPYSSPKVQEAEMARRKLLNQICTPLEEAQPGDIIGIFITSSRNELGSDDLPIASLARKTPDPSVRPKHTRGHFACVESPSREYEQVRIEDLPAQQLQDLAPSLMKFNLSTPNPVLRDELMDSMCEHPELEDEPHRADDIAAYTEYFQSLIMPQATLLHPNGYWSAIEALYGERDLTQGIVDCTLRGIVHGRPETAHEGIEMRSRLQLLLDFVNASYPLPLDYEIDEEQEAPFILPPLDKILNS